MRKLMVFALIVAVCLFLISGCSGASSDDIQQERQEKLLKEGTAQTGMPAIKNFRERKLLKDILELRDQEGLTTYTYIVAEMTGKLIFLGETIGYGIPYATQYTNPTKVDSYANSIVLPQADPNGLFSPSSAEGTWVVMKDPNSKDVKVVYVESRIIVSPFKLKTVE